MRADELGALTIGRSKRICARDRSSDITRFADNIGVLARGARILVLSRNKDGAFGIKAARVRPAAAWVPCCIRLNQASVNVLATRFARVVLFFTPSQGRGRREDRAPAGTRGPLCAKAIGNCTAAYRAAKTSRPSLRSGFTAYVVLSPGRRALLPPSPCGLLTRSSGWTTRITTRLGASFGRQDHTILPYASCAGRVRDAFAHGLPPCDHLAPTPLASTAVRPACRDDRDTPLFLGPE
jgi:hypothetical protein